MHRYAMVLWTLNHHVEPSLVTLTNFVARFFMGKLLISTFSILSSFC